MSSPIALIFGAGKNVGASVAKSFAAKGYKVAIASRSSKHNLSDSEYFHTPCDLGDPSSVEKVFDAVRSKFGHPSVVVYNAAMHIGSPSNTHPLGLPLSDLQKTLDVNFSSAYVALQQAVSSFEQPSTSTQTKAFIYTGNCLNVTPLAPLFSNGVGKAAAANMLAYMSIVYKERGYRFYYADERNMDGSPAYGKISGEAAGEFYSSLAKGDEKVPWEATFVKGHGYKNFGEIKL